MHDCSGQRLGRVPLSRCRRLYDRGTGLFSSSCVYYTLAFTRTQAIFGCNTAQSYRWFFGAFAKKSVKKCSNGILHVCMLLQLVSLLKEKPKNVQVHAGGHLHAIIFYKIVKRY